MKTLRKIHLFVSLLSFIGWAIWILLRTDPQYKTSDLEPFFFILLYGTISSQALLISIYVIYEGILADRKKHYKRKIMEIEDSMNELENEPKYKRPHANGRDDSSRS